ncbi:MAG: hypothetical protein NTZ24_02155, partial [Deltaproteobacteria bacterium]|nr:hypothetical protein [Deltaproteobacteria bacterium]
PARVKLVMDLGRCNNWPNMLLTPMLGAGTTTDENHPHPSLPRRREGYREGAFSYKENERGITGSGSVDGVWTHIMY